MMRMASSGAIDDRSGGTTVASLPVPSRATGTGASSSAAASRSTPFPSSTRTIPSAASISSTACCAESGNAVFKRSSWCNGPTMLCICEMTCSTSLVLASSVARSATGGVPSGAGCEPDASSEVIRCCMVSKLAVAWRCEAAALLSSDDNCCRSFRHSSSASCALPSQATLCPCSLSHCPSSSSRMARSCSTSCCSDDTRSWSLRWLASESFHCERNFRSFSSALLLRFW
mmetsp:Transcript_13277/g.29520  ORF Transcript_13277/g.29520 Transcript_13277/m.29520 type:complete len:230 (-) Transcript_13277:879-1568(-)